MSVTRAVVLVVVAAALGGCYRDFTIVDPPARDGGSASRDAAVPPVDAPWREPSSACTEASAVDLLFVVDSSGSMAEEQASLAEQLPRLITDLVAPPDLDGDGAPDWRPIDDLHVGVVTTDLGSGGFSAPTCDRGTFGSRFGDDAVLRTQPSMLPGCAGPYPAVFEFAPGADAATFAADVACVATVGIDGCGFEQPLEAALKALSPSAPTRYTGPSYVPPTFFEGTRGHADGANRGFLRDSSLLAVVILTDEEDCSARDPEIFDPSSPTYGPIDLNLRCFQVPDAIHPVERYVAGLLALRATRLDLVALAVIAGIPVTSAVALPSAEDYDRILAHPAMQERIDPAMPTRLVPSCNTPGRGIAFPPRRLVRTAAGLGEGRSTVQSICQEDFSPAIAPIVELIRRRACASREIL